MDQNKIKDCFNSVNIPVLPRCDELLTNYEFSHKSKLVKLNFKVMYIGILTIILSLTLIFLANSFCVISLHSRNCFIVLPII